MRATHSSKGATPENYVQQLRLGSQASSNVYLLILTGFQRFLAERADGKGVSQEAIRQWLNDRIRLWSFHTVTIRARLIDRFLDWMVQRGALADNPFADLRGRYGQRTTKPIVQALLNQDSEAALEALRQAPRFGSFLGPVMREYVALKQAMGYCYKTEETRLLLLDRFLQRRPDLSGQPLPVLIREWMNTGSTPQHAFVCHLTGRVLSRALSRVDPTTRKIPWDKRIFQQARNRYRKPYIFSDQEFLRLLEAALTFPSPQSPLRPQTLHMMLVLAYCAGLRIGEIVRLNVGDFDGDDRTIEIRRTKFFKSRRLPLSDSVVAGLLSYLEARKQAGAPTTADAPLFWHRQAASRYSRGTTEGLLIRVLRGAELKPAPGRTGPHIHDCRHHADILVMPTVSRELRVLANWRRFSAQLISEIRHNPDVHSDLPRDSEKRMRILERLMPTSRSLRDNRWFRTFRGCSVNAWCLASIRIHPLDIRPPASGCLTQDPVIMPNLGSVRRRLCASCAQEVGMTKMSA